MLSFDERLQDAIELVQHGQRTVALTGAGSSMQALQQRIDAGEVDPTCSECGGYLKSATILFGQRVPEPALSRAKDLSSSCDLFLVVGSSLKVTPAANLPRLALAQD